MSRPPFERVVSEHGAVVLRVCRAILGPVDADDAWSETFVSALRGYPTLPANSNVRGWLVTIAHNKSIDILRARSRRAVPTADLPEPSATELSPTDSAGDVDDELRERLDALPPKQRRAVIYRHIADLSYADVAELLGGTQAAARRNVADGIAALRRHDRGENR